LHAPSTRHHIVPKNKLISTESYCILYPKTKYKHHIISYCTQKQNQINRFLPSFPNAFPQQKKIKTFEFSSSTSWQHCMTCTYHNPKQTQKNKKKINSPKIKTWSNREKVKMTRELKIWEFRKGMKWWKHNTAPIFRH
jgi:hypothetical protein